MANEISVTSNLTATKLGATIASGSKTKQITMAGTQMVSSTQVIATTSTLVTLGGITLPPAYVRITNLDDTNYLLLSGETGFSAVFQLKLLAGQFALFPPLNATIYASANAAAINILKDAVDA